MSVVNEENILVCIFVFYLLEYFSVYRVHVKPIRVFVIYCLRFYFFFWFLFLTFFLEFTVSLTLFIIIISALRWNLCYKNTIILS